MKIANKYPITKGRKFVYTADEKKQASIKELKKFFKYYTRFKLPLFAVGVLLIFIGACSIITPIFTGNMIALFTDDFNGNLILKYALIVLGVSTVSNILGFLLNKLWVFISINSVFYITKDLTVRINEITQSSFDNAESGTFTTRLYSDVSTVGRAPLDIMNFIAEAFTQIGFVSYTFSLNVWIGIFMLVYVLISIGLEYYRINLRQKNRKVIRKVGEREGSFRHENLRGMKDIKSVNATENIIQQSMEITKEKLEYEYTSSKKMNWYGRLRHFALDIMAFAFIALCTYLLVNGQIELAVFMIAYNYRGRISGFANYIVNIKSYMSECALAAFHLNEIFDETKYPIEKFGSVELENVTGNLEFNNVTFGYTEDTTVLNNVNLNFEPNKITSIVGLSGAGKSTIVSLINRLYDLKSDGGEILLDGVNIKGLTKHSLRSNICYISQSPYIYNMTIEQNLRLAKENATTQEIEEALKKANIYDYVMTLPDGLNSKLGENGIKLSGGQKQRIAIARAILRDSKILLFDEATSALDNKNQAEIKHTIKNLAQNHTIVMIAHRLSTVVDSDNIVFIKDGAVYAQGKHEQLMQTCKEYYGLYVEEDLTQTQNWLLTCDCFLLSNNYNYWKNN